MTIHKLPRITALLFLIFLSAKSYAGPEKSIPEWDQDGCGVVKEDLHLAPKSLFAEFIKRDQRGDFLQSNDWLDRAVVCPLHMGGPDTMRIASKATIKQLSRRKFMVTYRIEGQVSSIQVGNTYYSKFIPKQERLVETYNMIQTPWGWKLTTPWSDSKVTLSTALQHAEKLNQAFDEESKKALARIH